MIINHIIDETQSKKHDIIFLFGLITILMFMILSFLFMNFVAQGSSSLEIDSRPPTYQSAGYI